MADSSMTPENIVDTAIKENLQVVAITDHNEIGNVQRALDHAAGKQILVVPGVELTTPQGHLLIYLKTVQDLQRFYGKLKISDDKKVCYDTISQCLKYAAEYGGFGVCAHVDSASGLESAHPKFDAFKQDIFNCENLMGLEIVRAESSQWFTHSDDNPDRRNCVVTRCASLKQEEGTELAKLMSSDAHSLAALGKNASGNRRLTRIKMESLSFDSLRIALRDTAARVRLEDLIPPTIPHFVGMKLEGGFLKDQVINFSKNLTCIIGGRGAGKSTMLGSLMVASGNDLNSSIVDSSVWPDEISLVYQDEAGQQHVLTRAKSNEVINCNADGPTWVAIESYGQGETAETIQHCDKDPNILLRFLDGFIDLEALNQEDELLRNQLLENQTLIEGLQRDINQIADTEKNKKVADAQVAALKSQNAAKVVELEEKLAKERRFRDHLKNSLSNLLTSINECLTSKDLHKLTAEQDGSQLAAGKAEFDTVKALVTELAADVDELSERLKKKVTEINEKINSQLKVWAEKEKGTQATIEDIRRDLEKQNIKLDMAFIRKVTKDATDLAGKLTELKKNIPKQQEAFKVRRGLVESRRLLKDRIFMVRQAFAKTMNGNLAATVVEYKVSIRFHQGVLSNELETLLKTAMGWRTSQVPRASIIASSLSPFSLLAAIEKKDAGVVEGLVDACENKVFTNAEAVEIIEKMSEWENRVALERCLFEDRPEIKVSRMVELEGGRRSNIVKDFSALSLGQQQSILLSVLLFSKSKTPLIIDQPEDNLDSEFIYKTLVKSLRGIKEQRQVIIVTHNANIAVLGDAELIIPLRGASEYSVIRDRGSIDNTETKEIVCTILEGSQKAFRRRQEVYGY